MSPSRSVNRGDVVQVAMRRIVLDRGLAGLSVRAIADGCRIAPSTLLAQFSNRARLLHRFSVRLRRTLHERNDERCHRQGLVGMLPPDPEALDDLRLWHAVCELGHDSDPIAAVVARMREDEERVVTILLRRHREGVLPTEDEVALLLAVLDGLRHAMVRRRARMPVETARELLARHLAQAGLGNGELDDAGLGNGELGDAGLVPGVR